MKRLLKFVRKAPPALPIFDSSGWYADWYFEYRLEEEVARAERYGMTFTVLYILIDGESSSATDRRRNALGSLLADGFRRSDLPARLSENEFAVILPNTDTRGAMSVQERLHQFLDEFHPAVGLANYPQDSREEGDLLTLAAHRALASASNPEACDCPESAGTQTQSPFRLALSWLIPSNIMFGLPSRSGSRYSKRYHIWPVSLFEFRQWSRHTSRLVSECSAGGTLQRLQASKSLKWQL